MNLTAAYFKNKYRFSSLNYNKEQLAVYREQEKKYGSNIDVQLACQEDSKLLLKTFVESETEALHYQIQGQLFPMLHYKIKKLACSSLKEFSDEEIIAFYFHCLRLGNLYLPKEHLFPLYQQAIIQLLPLLNESSYLINSLHNYQLYLLFGVKHTNDIQKVKDTTYSDFKKAVAFIALCKSYTSYPNMRKKQERFLPYCDNALLMERIERDFVVVFTQQNGDFTKVLSGSFMLLLLSENSNCFEDLLQLHQSDLVRHQVWLLGSFYKDFQTTENQKKLLLDLYANYEKQWVDEYQ